MTFVMIFGFCITASAEECHSESLRESSDSDFDVTTSLDGVTVKEYTFELNSTGSTNELLPGIVEPNTTITLNPVLKSTGSRKLFVVNATSDNPNSISGMLEVFLYNPSGKLVSNQWVVGVNEAVNWSFFFPPTGTWTCKILAYLTEANVFVQVGWVG